jgi:hypothetical protein
MEMNRVSEDYDAPIMHSCVDSGYDIPPVEVQVWTVKIHKYFRILIAIVTEL